MQIYFKDFVGKTQVVQSSEDAGNAGILAEIATKLGCGEECFWAVHAGRPVGADSVPLKDEATVCVALRVLGGIDFQGRAGVKFGKGMQSTSQEGVQRQERLRQLALETMDITKDPYFMRNNTGGCECKLCYTSHPSEANYMAHTQAKRHQEGLRKRAKESEDIEARAAHADRRKQVLKRKVVRIGRPGYRVTKARDTRTGDRCITFDVDYPDGQEGLQPRHRFMSAFEQRVEECDKRYQYVVMSCDPYENVAFKVPAWPIDRGEGKVWSKWDVGSRVFTLQVSFLNPAYLAAEAEAREEAAALAEAAAKAERARAADEAVAKVHALNQASEGQE